MTFTFAKVIFYQHILLYLQYAGCVHAVQRSHDTLFSQLAVLYSHFGSHRQIQSLETQLDAIHYDVNLNMLMQPTASQGTLRKGSARCKRPLKTQRSE